MMDAETWLTASEAKAKGFVDSIRNTKAKLAASALESIDFSNLPNVPAQFRSDLAGPSKTYDELTNWERQELFHSDRETFDRLRAESELVSS